jgi:hypothetical protein
MKVSTRNYQDDHGKAPAGIGTWAFDVCRNGSWTTIVAPAPMKLADAKKWAIREARAMNADFVQVGS